MEKNEAAIEDKKNFIKSEKEKAKNLVESLQKLEDEIDNA